MKEKPEQGYLHGRRTGNYELLIEVIVQGIEPGWVAAEVAGAKVVEMDFLKKGLDKERYVR